MVQGASCRVQVAGCRVQVAGCRLHVAGCRLQVAGYRLQGAEYYYYRMNTLSLYCSWLTADSLRWEICSFSTFINGLVTYISLLYGIH